MKRVWRLRDRVTDGWYTGTVSFSDPDDPERAVPTMTAFARDAERFDRLTGTVATLVDRYDWEPIGEIED